MQKEKIPFGVLIVNLGTPDEPTKKSIRRFLREFLADPRVIDVPRFIWWFILNLFILPLRPRKIVHSYNLVWTEEGSPLRAIVLRQQKALSEKLESIYKQKVPVAVGMNYGNPSLKEGLLSLRRDQVEKVIILPLYPQYSVTTATVFDKLAHVLRKCSAVPEMRMVHDYYNHPAYIYAIAETIVKHRSQHGKPDKLVFSFHGIPQRYDDRGDPYVAQCHETGRLVAEHLGLKSDEWIVTFQSRFGPAEWVKPYTMETLQNLPADGTRSIHVISPGFSADCLETLEELAIQNRDVFMAAGGEHFSYIPALNSDPLHINLLADLVVQQSAGWLPDTKE